MANHKEFWAKESPVMDEYYEILTESGKKGKELEESLKNLIKKDPDFLDPYTVLYDEYMKSKQELLARTIISQAYEKAVNLISDKKGSWPKYIAWGYLENRHILRALGNYGVQLWIDEKNEAAVELFSKLLLMCPEDNMGIRFHLLGVLLDYDYATYFHHYEDENGLQKDDWEWFEKEAPQFKKYFDPYIE